MVFRDSDPRKWEYRQHTAAKHRVLSRYMKAWISILGRDAYRRGRRAEVVVVDAFAGRGRYAEGEVGSPLIFREIAGLVISDRRVDQVELFFIERDPDNHAALVNELASAPPPMGVIERSPARSDFAVAGRRVLELLGQRHRPAFWFIDPFGFSGMPLELVRDILSLPQSEAFITFMARDVNRFLDQPNHRVAVGQLLGLKGGSLDTALVDVMGSDKREHSLRDLYIRRLREGGGAKYVWPFRVASGGPQETLYYLIHASNHPKALREMKDATWEESQGAFAFLGKDDFATTGQLRLPVFDADVPGLKARLGQVFAGKIMAYEDLLNEAYPDPRFHMFVERHFRSALNEMAKDGAVTKIPITSKTQRGLSGGDQLRFPPEGR
jgi:three-Cys-motif partner protein